MASSEPATAAPQWLVLDSNGGVMAVLEDDAEFAEKVAQTKPWLGLDRQADGRAPESRGRAMTDPIVSMWHQLNGGST